MNHVICLVHVPANSDGSVYPCDFYTDDSNCIGNIFETNFDFIHKNNLLTEFILNSRKNRNSKCEICNYFTLCRNGCKKYRAENNLNKFCSAYYNFFEYSLPKFTYLKNYFYKAKF